MMSRSIPADLVLVVRVQIAHTGGQLVWKIAVKKPMS